MNRDKEGKLVRLGFGQEYMLCPEGHVVYLRIWNMYRKGTRRCRECERDYELSELREDL